MKVYVCYAFELYEGYSSPLMVFDNETAAKYWCFGDAEDDGGFVYRYKELQVNSDAD